MNIRKTIDSFKNGLIDGLFKGEKSKITHKNKDYIKIYREGFDFGVTINPNRIKNDWYL